MFAIPIRKIDAAAARVRKRTKPEEVGYCKPPKQHQFKPGQSGNPKGRPKKEAPDPDKILAEALETKMKSKENAREKSAIVLELLVRKLIEQALKGNQKAVPELLNRYVSIKAKELSVPDKSGGSPEDVTTADLEMLKHLFGKDVSENG